MHGLLHRSLALLSYQNKKLAEQYSLLITKKPVEFDYVAVDVTGMISGALRLSKNIASEARRQREVSRHVMNGLQQLLSTKIHCRKALLLAMDGAECLTKADVLRHTPLTARSEQRLRRLPGTPLVLGVEDRLAKSMPNPRLCGASDKVLLSGTGVFGSAEEKMSAWALDLACRPDYDANKDSVCFIGSGELYMSTWALTPFYNICNAVLHGSDLRRMRLFDILAWLNVHELTASADMGTALSAVRTDTLFLYLLCNGCAVTELDGVSGLTIASTLDAYFKVAPVPGTTKKANSVSSEFLFTMLPGNQLQLSLDVLFRVLTAWRSQTVAPLLSTVAEEYLEYVLQTHAMLCVGRTPDPLFSFQIQQRSTTSAPSISVSLSELLGHLSALCQEKRTALVGGAAAAAVRCARRPVHPSAARGEEGKSTDGKYNPFWRVHQPPTAAEYTTLCQPQPAFVESLLQTYVGAAPKPEIARHIALSPNIREAQKLVQHAFSYANAARAHKALCFAPSYLWWCTKRRAGMWRMSFVDIGERGYAAEARRARLGSAEKWGAELGGASDDVAVVHNPTTQRWEPVPSFPYVAAPKEPGDVSVSGTSPPLSSSLRVLTWNVMFDRYSGQPTPLGMPGIDWCSTRRYPVLAKLIQQEDADVVAMQEVEQPFAAFLLAQPWCRASYVVSCGPASSVLNPWGVLMLVHRRRGADVARLSHFNVPAWSGHTSLMPVVSFQLGAAPVHVAGVHLLAPFSKGNRTARTKQDMVLQRHIMSAAFAPVTDDAIVMGDFNDWPESEFLMPRESQYVECWPLLHPNDPGKTMDETNTFCKLKIEEIFFGRSDKVFMRTRGRLKPVEGHLVGLKSVNVENDNKEAPEYLFPSDHYGVSVLFERK